MALPKERYMTVMGGYTLDMHDHGRLLHQPLVERIAGKDYGADPIEDGTFRMIPSGDVVDYAERCKRLAK